MPRLHVLTSDDIITRPDFLPVATALLHALGARGALHLRTRILSGSVYRTIAKHLFDVSKMTGGMLVINDRIDVALAIGGEAVQLGSQSLQPTDVNRIAPHLRVGVSVHTPQEAESAGPAAWIMAGNIYDTSTHPDIPGRGLEFLRTVVQSSKVPVIAVGGIRPEHVAPILRLGAAGVAVITGIWDERTPKDAALRYLSNYGDGTG